MKFIRLLFFFLLIFRAWPQATPPQYIYGDPLPTSGDTPHSQIRLTQALVPIAYDDERPVVWDDFVGGGYHTCLTTTERDQILQGRRKEGMLVWVAANDHTYKLQSNLTSWTDLGVLAAGGGGSVNIFNSNGSLTSNRSLTGLNFNLDFIGLGIFTVTANSSMSFTAPTVTLNGGSFTRINNSGPYPFIFPAAPSLSASTDQLLARDPVSGNITFTPTATIASASGLYRGVVSGTPGTWVAATAALSPSYSSGSQPPEATVAVLKFPSNSVGSDTLQFGDNTTGIPIDRRDGTAIQADDITAGQYIVFTRSGTTSGSHWTCESCGGAGVAPAPSANQVLSIDSTADLITSTAEIVITRGYYTPGDGGHAAYRLDAGSSDSTNTVTCFEASVGRYFLMQSGSISARQAGAVVDGVTDDHDALQALLDNCTGITARLDPGSYYSSAGIDLPDDVKLIARGCDITIDLNGETGVAVGSRCTVDGGRWTFARQSGGSNGFDNSGFTFGTYTAAGSVSNSVVQGVHVALTGYAASPFFITGGSHTITIRGFTHDDSATIDDVVVVHWGYVSGSETNGTLHPHNILIEQGTIGQLTSGSTDGCPVFVSGAYDVLVQNISCERARHGAIAVVGDYGFKYSGFAAQTLGSVVFRNVTCKNVQNIGILVQGVGVSSQIYPQEFVFEDCTMIGPNNGSNNGGAYLSTARNATFRNCLFAGHSTGTTFSGDVKNITFDDCTFTTNYYGGLVVDDASLVGLNVVRCKAFKNGWGVTGNSASGIQLINGSQAKITDCKLGDVSGTEPNQEAGIYVATTFTGTTLMGNHTYGVKAGVATAYSIGSSSDAPDHLWLVTGNTAAAGVTLYTGLINVPYAVRGKYRYFTGTGTPTLGTYLKGDRVTIDEATSTPFEKACSVAGTPGTWVTSY